MTDSVKSLLAVVGVFAIGTTMAACDLWGDDDGEDECTNPSPQTAPPQLVPATLAELRNAVTAVVALDQSAGVSLTLNIGYDSTRFETDTVDPPQCPQLFAIATLNGAVMLTGDQTPVRIETSCAPSEYECASPTFTLPPTFDSALPLLQFSLRDSSGVFNVDLSLPEVSLDGPNVLAPKQTVSATLSPAGIVPTQVVIGAPELGVVFFDVTPELIPKAGGFSFVMPNVDLTVSSEGVADSDWDAGPHSCGQGGAALPCNAALCARVARAGIIRKVRR